MSLETWFNKGMTAKEYIEGMKVNQEGLLAIHQQFELGEADRKFYRSLRAKELRGIVLTADWCGDAMLCVPILMRIAEEAEMDLRFLNRDDHLELMDQYLTNGKSRSIPIFIFIDQAGSEQAVWGPRAPEVQHLVEEVRSMMPDPEDAEFETKQKEIYRSFKQQIKTETIYWEAVNRSIQERLKMALFGQ
ncbi:thioredoxin family protein [Marininema halotolerans]|uniref:Thioredoxin n=1 Tax=Marininema halotolerans TaxID=1155944 RepID=A0A1I6TKQ8_9BACL|nr:thioredoxin family protein [Marininema halotolerans]SFS89809.1 Thioredoxin [Marininema halotolerans]